MDEKYLPWEEDELEFLPGDWEIERADTPGFYNYAIGGIQSLRSVDGVQLVEWGMAALLRYTMLAPWENSGIEFNGKAEIARDVLDRDGNVAERKYLVFVGKKLMRVNKYYLVKNDMAEGSEAFKRSVSQRPVRSNKYNKTCKPWVSDDILIKNDLPSEVEKIERGATEGTYRVKIGRSSFTWWANSLIDKNYAVDGYSVKLEELCDSEKISLSSYKDATHGFWMCDSPGAVKTLRDIAKLWRELEKGYDGALAKKIMSSYDYIYVGCDKKEKSLDGYGAALAALDKELDKYNKNLEMLESDYAELKPYLTKRINDNINSYESLKNRFVATREKVKELRESLKDRSEQLQNELDCLDCGDDGEKTEVFPIELLPQSLQEIVRGKYDNIMTFKERFDERRSDLKFQAAMYTESAENSQKFTDICSGFYEVDANIQSIITRRRELDDAKTSIDARLLNKKPMFPKKDKNSRIRFITKVKISIEGYGKYAVYDKLGKGPVVTAEELVYMKLAEYYY